MHRDLVAMNDRSKSSDDKLAGTIEAVHASLKQLAQQVERAAPLRRLLPFPRLRPRRPSPPPFAERVRDLAPLPGTPSEQDAALKPVETNGGKEGW